MTYRDLNIHQRINVKSWVRHDIPIPCVYHSVLLYDTGLPHQLANNIDTQCDRESRLFRRNWSQVRFPRQSVQSVDSALPLATERTQESVVV